ncbi:MAG: uroporphyrinogen-III synthase [Actinomycetes bacterium]|jgi:uroporphyrinogen III methyltransferase/synthase|nr:uroporphyrinogen-III synthase [Actinomycetes bacterium]
MGATICLTRAEGQNAKLADRLTSAGFRVVLFPTIAFEPPPDTRIVKTAIAHIANYDWLVFTSKNAVHFFSDYLRAADVPTQQLPRTAVVGSATARALEKHGIHVDLIPTDYHAEGLIAAFEQFSPGEGHRVLIPRALKAREILPETLRERGFEVTVAPVYQTVRPEPTPNQWAGLVDADDQPRPDAIVFTSPSTVKNFGDILIEDAELDPTHFLNRMQVFSIGAVTTEALREAGVESARIAQAEKSTSAGLAAVICNTLA